MSGTIFLIVEDENDGKVVREVLKKRGIRIEPLFPTGGSGSISRLAAQLPKLIADAKRKKRRNDCIAVLHDYDVQKQQENRHPYQQIEQICANEAVKEIIAIDELEAWMLADSGICQWLRMNPRNWDEQKKPKEELKRKLRSVGMTYEGKNRAKVVSHLNGDGDKHSPSMRDALAHLENAPCVRP